MESSRHSSSSSLYSTPQDAIKPIEPHESLVDIEKQTVVQEKVEEQQNLDLQRRASHVTSNPGMPVDPFAEKGDEIYNRFSSSRKKIMTAVLSFTAVLAPVSSTTVLSAVPEVAAQFSTTGDVVNLSNALYLVFMGLSPLFWGPIGRVYGRRWPCLISAVMFLAFSIGTALSPNLVSFFVFRVLTAFQGTSFLIVGSNCIADIYRPVERATALGWFLSGTLLGPALGPLLGGLIVTYKSWRVIFWLQSALAGTAVVLVALLLPETIHRKKSEDLKGLNRKEYCCKLWEWTNPVRVVKLYRYPNLVIAGMASSILLWNMYSFLTPIRYVLDPRFNLTTPLQAGLFYLAPGAGYLAGTFMGGRWADCTVKKYILKRGERVPEDRLRSLIPFMGAVIPGCMLVYGWCIEKEKGGIALPVVVMFIQGVAQLFCFPSLNVYCLEFNPSRATEIVAGNFCLRYLWGALGTALVLPAVQRIGVGWFSTISSAALVIMTTIVYLNVEFGRGWRERIDAEKATKEEL